MNASVEGDGRLGVADNGPYNAIHVGAAADSLPQEVNISILIYSGVDRL